MQRLVTIVLYLLCTESSQAAQHQCGVTKSETAGFSGSVEITRGCNLTLLGVRGKFSIPGIKKEIKCSITDYLTINQKSYCKNESVIDTLIEATNGELKFVQYPPAAQSYTLNYYKVYEIGAGEPDQRSINMINDETFYDGFVSSADYPEQQKTEGQLQLTAYITGLPIPSYVTFSLYSDAKMIPIGAKVLVDQGFASSIISHNFSSIFSLPNRKTSAIVSIPSNTSGHPVFLLRYTVVTCDRRSIPIVNHATPVIRTKLDNGLLVPGTVSAIYNCYKGYKLTYSEENKADCVYKHAPQEGRPTTKGTNLTTAVWTNTLKVICVDSSWIIAVIIVACIVVIVLLVVVGKTMTKKSESIKPADPAPQSPAVNTDPTQQSPAVKTDLTQQKHAENTDLTPKKLAENLELAIRNLAKDKGPGHKKNTSPQVATGDEENKKGKKKRKQSIPQVPIIAT